MNTTEISMEEIVYTCLAALDPDPPRQPKARKRVTGIILPVTHPPRPLEALREQIRAHHMKRWSLLLNSDPQAAQRHLTLARSIARARIKDAQHRSRTP
jgi:hypothetical protein